MKISEHLNTSEVDFKVTNGTLCGRHGGSTEKRLKFHNEVTLAYQISVSTILIYSKGRNGIGLVFGISIHIKMII